MLLTMLCGYFYFSSVFCGAPPKTAFFIRSPISRPLILQPPVAIRQPRTNWVYLKGGLGMKKRQGGGGGERRMKPRQGSDQGSKFNIQHCVYIGKAHRTHPLFCKATWVQQSNLLSSGGNLHIQPRQMTKVGKVLCGKCSRSVQPAQGWGRPHPILYFYCLFFIVLKGATQGTRGEM